MPRAGAPVEPAGGVIGGTSPWCTYTGWSDFGPSTWNGAAGGSPVSWRRFVARGDQRLDAVPGVGAVDVGLERNRRLSAPAPWDAPVRFDSTGTLAL